MATDTELLPDESAAPPTPGATAPGRTAGWLRIGLPLLLVLVSAGLRFGDLADPGRQYFDEIYYAEDAASYLDTGVEGGRAVHPMVGKWLIAAGIAAAGDDALGWRLASATAGTLTVLVLYLAGLRLFRRRGIAALAALLLSVDGMALTASRIAMLDVFLALFVVTAFWLLLRDRDRQWAASVDVDPAAGRAAAVVTPVVPLPRLLAGVVLGLAFATKWSAVLAIGAAGLFVLGSEYAWRRRVGGRATAAWWRPLVSAAVTLVAVPAAVYVVSYASWFANYEHTQPGQRHCAEATDECAFGVGRIAGDWFDEQVANLRFHRTLEADHRYRAPAWTWPTLSRPVAYYYESCRPDRAEDADPCEVAPGQVEEILGIGNPAVWWAALVIGYPAVAVGLWRRDWRAWAIAAFLLGQFLPWLVAPRPVFLFYTVPLVPFIALALAYGAQLLERRPSLRWVPGGIATLAVVGLLFWWPLFVGEPISEGAWRMRIFFDSWI